MFNVILRLLLISQEKMISKLDTQVYSWNPKVNDLKINAIGLIRTVPGQKLR